MSGPTACQHLRVDRDVYEYCEDCGAARRRVRPGQPEDEWHSCALCSTLAESLRDIVTEAGLEFSDPRVSYETWQLDPGAIERGRATLAAHDARRK